MAYSEQHIRDQSFLCASPSKFQCGRPFYVMVWTAQSVMEGYSVKKLTLSTSSGEHVCSVLSVKYPWT